MASLAVMTNFQYSPTMNTELLLPIVRHLYEGGGSSQLAILSEQLTFQDPLVIVRGLQPVEVMFGRLNRLLPASRVLALEPTQQTQHPCAWSLRIEYRRANTSKPFLMQSVLEVDVVHGTIERLTEHWKSPLPARGNSQKLLSTAIRTFLGRLTSV